MLRITGRLRYHPPDKVAEYIDEALDLLDGYGDRLTAGEREQLLPVAVTLLSNTQVEVEQMTLGVAPGNGLVQ